MESAQSYIACLLLKEIAGQLSEKEVAELKEWKEASGLSAEDLKLLSKVALSQQKAKEYAEAYRRAQEMVVPEVESYINSLPDEQNNINVQEEPEAMPPSFDLHTKRRSVLQQGWFRYAAAVILLIGVSIGFLLLRDSDAPDAKETLSVVNPANDIEPGGNKAVLTLADGSVIILDSTADGNIAVQGGSAVVKLGNGQLRYDGRGLINDSVMLNVLSTPRGGTYQLELPDGTKVWLNALSSIKYPAAFVDTSRTVELSGEAFFEVARDASKPFYVRVVTDYDGIDYLNVRALGTGFNINAYHDEPALRTTLLSGAVQISVGKGNDKVLQPGQQGVVTSKTMNIQTRAVDTEQVLAWKNGYFSLDGTGIESVMRQLSRWYDVEVIYKGSFSNDDFAGHIPRSATLSQALKMLELTDVVQFEINDRKVTISQKH